ncbi:jg18844, partial [Pararge aegeria aegeria]
CTSLVSLQFAQLTSDVLRTIAFLSPKSRSHSQVNLRI